MVDDIFKRPVNGRALVMYNNFQFLKVHVSLLENNVIIRKIINRYYKYLFMSNLCNLEKVKLVKNDHV